MTSRFLGRFVVLAISVSLASCATTQRNSTKIGLATPAVSIKNEQFAATFNARQTTAAMEMQDGANVTKLANLTSNANKQVQFSRPAVSPNQDAVAYVQSVGQKHSIYRQSLGSPAKSPVTSEPGVNLTPTFTPDGRFIIFSSDRSGEGQSLWRKRADGAGGTTQITSSNSFDWQPAIASDGETIIFQSHRKNNIAASIWSINMNGGLLTQLAQGRSPAVSPNGRKIVFVRDDASSGRSQVWSMQIDGSGLTQLSDGSASDADPSWHPNGRFIVFSSNATVKEGDTFADSNIWLMRSDGTRRVQLTENFSHDDAPVFESRGKKIVFRSNRGGFWNLFSFNPKL